jgi:hypothetical protein
MLHMLYMWFKGKKTTKEKEKKNYFPALPTT